MSFRSFSSLSEPVPILCPAAVAHSGDQSLSIFTTSTAGPDDSIAAHDPPYESSCATIPPAARPDEQLALEFPPSHSAETSTPPIPDRSSASPSGQQWQDIVTRIQSNDIQGFEELDRALRRGLKCIIVRHVGLTEADDLVQEVLLIVIEAIRKGALRDPACLLGFVRTVTRRQIASHIDRICRARAQDIEDLDGAELQDHALSPELRFQFREQQALMTTVLRALSTRERDILARFYLYEQTAEQICEEMGLTATQFRLLKCRAKARFGEMGRQRLQGRVKSRV